jgi:hypothetical protein
VLTPVCMRRLQCREGVREGRRAKLVLPLVRLRPLLRRGGVREGRRACEVLPLEGDGWRRRRKWKGRGAEGRGG